MQDGGGGGGGEGVINVWCVGPVGNVGMLILYSIVGNVGMLILYSIQGTKHI